MLTFNNYEIDLRSIPGEVCLTFYICDCPCHCQGCSSPWLWLPGKRELTAERLKKAVAKLPYATCILFMGGDNDLISVSYLAAVARSLGKRAAFYSGRELQNELIPALDYYKTGPWMPAYGPLNAPTTNQRLYRIEDGAPVDITATFWTRENQWKPQQEEEIEKNRTEWYESLRQPDDKGAL